MGGASRDHQGAVDRQWHEAGGSGRAHGGDSRLHRKVRSSPFPDANLGRRKLTLCSKQQYRVQFNKWGWRKNKRRIDQRTSSPETGELFSSVSVPSVRLRCHKIRTHHEMVKRNQPDAPPPFARRIKCHPPTTSLIPPYWGSQARPHFPTPRIPWVGRRISAKP